jgi:hypothetical protein
LVTSIQKDVVTHLWHLVEKRLKAIGIAFDLSPSYRIQGHVRVFKLVARPTCTKYRDKCDVKQPALRLFQLFPSRPHGPLWVA